MSTSTLETAVKRYLNITWSDNDTSAKITDMVSNAIPTLAFKLGIKQNDIDFNSPGQERSLFLDYCRYCWEGYKEEFDKAYLSEILQIRMKYEVRYNEDES